MKLSRKGLEIAVLSLLLGLGALGSAMFASELWLPFALASAVTGLCAISASINASAFLLPFLLLYTTGVFAAFLKSSGLAQTSSLFGAWFLVCLYSGGVFFIYFLYRLFEADSRFRRQGFWLSTMIGAATLIAYFSSGRGGADPMILMVMEEGYSLEQARQIVFYFRKSVHFTFYGVVGLLAFYAANAGLRALLVKITRSELWSSARFGLLFVLLHGCFDELRQTTFANREGSVRDVLIDLSGAIVFIGIAILLKLMSQRKPSGSLQLK